jgi:hypothetical protein
MAGLPEWLQLARSFAAARTKMVRRSFVNSFPFNSGKNGSDHFGPKKGRGAGKFQSFVMAVGPRFTLGRLEQSGERPDGG